VRPARSPHWLGYTVVEAADVGWSSKSQGRDPTLALVLELSIWWNCSNTRFNSSGGIPGPVSVTATVKEPFMADAVMRTSPVSVT